MPPAPVLSTKSPFWPHLNTGDKTLTLPFKNNDETLNVLTDSGLKIDVLSDCVITSCIIKFLLYLLNKFCI